MQKLLTLDSVGLKGLNSDVTSWDLPPEFITSGKNFRVFANSIRSSGGYTNWASPPVNFHGGRLMHVGATSGDFWLIAGRTAIYAYNGQDWFDVTSAEGYSSLGDYDELKWSMCELGSIAVVNNPQHQPEYWPTPSSGGSPMVALPWDHGGTAGAARDWGSQSKSCDILRAHKNFLFALGLKEGVEEISQGYRWSHPADINAIPYTWDETDPSSLAGRAQLGGDGGRIVDGLSLRDSFCIYSENSIDILDSNPDSQFVWRRRELSSTVGLIAQQCLIEVKGVHFFLADGDIVKNDGTSVDSIVHNRIRRQLTARMNADVYGRSYAVRNSALKEIWFCVPEENAEFPNVAYIYNWRDDSWAIRELPYEVDVTVEGTPPDDYPVRTVTSGMAHANYGAQASPSLTWNEWQGVWDDQTRVWGSRQLTPLNDTIVAVDNVDSSLKILDPSDTNAVDIDAGIERVNFPLEGHRGISTITRVYPHIVGTQPVRITIGSQDFAGGPVRWKPPVDFTPAVDRKIDVRSTGALHCWRVESLGSGNWQFSGMDIEYSPNGVR